MILRNRDNFPIESLPPRIKNAVQEWYTNTEFPIPLIVASFIGATSVACQNLIDVQLPYGSSSPVNLYIVVAADSGDGKSPTDRVASKSFRDFEADQAKNLALIMAHYQADSADWEIENKAIQSAIKKTKKLKLSTNDPNRLAELSLQNEGLQKKLKAHLYNKPQLPLRYKIIQSNTTPRKLAEDFSLHVPTAYLVSDEGGSLLKGHLMKDLEMLNRAWEGSPIQVDRLGLPSINVESPRLTITIQVQPEVVMNYLDGRGKESRGSGFLARCLIAYPISTKGTRYLSDRPQFTEHLTQFQSRITELLMRDKLELDQGREERLVLKFSDEAKKYWYDFQNRVEFDLNPGGYLSDIPDFASKITINVCRLAALFHYFEGLEGDISLATISQAGAICCWYVDEFKRLFGNRPQIPDEVKDVIEMERYLIGWAHDHPGETYILKSRIGNYGPNSLRTGCKRGRREQAINTLIMQGKIGIYLHEGKKWIGLHPSLFATTMPPLLPRL